MREVYIDNAATTKLDNKVLEAMMPYLSTQYGNPSSMHNMGIIAAEAISEARKQVAKLLNCNTNEIIFTGSGTESDNMAIFGYARKNKSKGNHIITTKVEHHAIEECFKRLEKEGFETTYLPVDKEGLVRLEDLKKAITKKTILVSIIYANNEIGTVQDIPAIAKICKEHNVAFHTDACQAAQYLDIDVKRLGADLMTLNGSKIYGPKGVGILYKKQGIQIEPLIYGGGQENNLRSGTENVANIVGFAKALELVRSHAAEESSRLTKLRDQLIKKLLELPETRLNGHPTQRLPNNANISFLNVEGESILLLLNEEGIYASTGSACSSKSLEPSHVLLALGLPHEVAHGSIRYSLGKDTTQADIDYAAEKTKAIVQRLRNISPLHYRMEEMLKR